MSSTYDPYWEWLRIPADRRPPTHYELLGLAPFERDLDKIRVGYKQRYAQVRTYEGGNYNDDAVRILEELSHACDRLTDPAAKRVYDAGLQHHPTIEGLAQSVNDTLADVPKEDVVFWFAILVAVNLQTSFLTPPFGFALFYLKGIAPKEVKIESIYLGIIPFVLLQLTALIIVIAYPGLALWLMHSVYD